MKPKNLANIVAMVALYRPGPMARIPDYISHMHDATVITYQHPDLEPIFKETYGVPIYQEQLMYAVMNLAGYTASEAYDFLKAISKKKAEGIEKHRKKFISGAKKHGVTEEKAAEIFTGWEDFARYGFNKSHAANYGMIAVKTAWLKLHYKVEYMTALLSASKNDIAKVAEYVVDSRALGINVLPPDVNTSGWDFTIETSADGSHAIRFGLGAIKNVGGAPVELITEERKNGTFKDLSDFAHRVDLRQVGKRSLECLIKVGALDSFGNRNALLGALDQLLAVSSGHFKAIECGQMSFFGQATGMDAAIILPSGITVDQRQQLDWEKELLGLYVSDHPLSAYQEIFEKKITHTSATLASARDKSPVTVAGLITKFRTIRTKKGDPMGFATIEDLEGVLELVLFPRTWDQYGKLIKNDVVISAVGKLDMSQDSPKILVDHLALEKPSPLSAKTSLPIKVYPVVDTQPIPVSPGTYPELEIEEENETGDWVEPPAEESALAQPEDPHFTTAPAEETILVREVFAAPGSGAATSSVSVQESPLPEVTPAAVKMPPMVMNFLISPLTSPPLREPVSNSIQMVTISLRGCGDKERDVRRINRLLGLLRSNPGKDRFAFLIFERGHRYLLEFPNDTTGFTAEIINKLGELVGVENLQVETIAIH